MQKHSIRVNVNGIDYERDVEPLRLLIDFLREDLGLTGAHSGCDLGQCGACTVLLDGESVKSCLVLAVQADGAEVLTVEGLARNGQIHPLQEAFQENHAVQCGYCTPGMLMAAYDLLQHHPHPSEPEIRTAISGNLCRCTGYVNIVKAIQAAATKGWNTALSPCDHVEFQA